MSAPRVLLVEVLDAAGSDIADAREHGAALRAAGAGGAVAAVAPDRKGSAAEPEGVHGTSATVPVFGADRAGLEGLRAFAGRGRHDLALVACASPGGGAVARALAAVIPTRWWPTGIAPISGWRARLGLGGAGEAPTVAEGDAKDVGTPSGMAWSTVERGRRARGRFAIWDGEYVLAPLPLDGEGGERILTGFADVAARRTELDLVVLAAPQPTFERQARVLGIGTRVHFVGPAPREAEWAWWTHAAAALVAGRGALSGGLVLRGLTTRCPMSLAADAGPCGAVARWLEARGATPAGHGRGAIAEALIRMLQRDRTMADAGAALASGHDPALIGRRLVATLGSTTIDSRRAAAA